MILVITDQWHQQTLENEQWYVEWIIACSSATYIYSVNPKSNLFSWVWLVKIGGIKGVIIVSRLLHQVGACGVPNDISLLLMIPLLLIDDLSLRNRRSLCTTPSGSIVRCAHPTHQPHILFAVLVRYK